METFDTEIGIKNCPASNYTNGQVFDPRYKPVFNRQIAEFTEWSVMDENNITALLGAQESNKFKNQYQEYIERSFEAKQNEAYYDIWTRPTIMWKLQCENEDLSLRSHIKAFRLTMK